MCLKDLSLSIRPRTASIPAAQPPQGHNFLNLFHYFSSPLTRPSYSPLYVWIPVFALEYHSGASQMQGNQNFNGYGFNSEQ